MLRAPSEHGERIVLPEPAVAKGHEGRQPPQDISQTFILYGPYSLLCKVLGRYA